MGAHRMDGESFYRSEAAASGCDNGSVTVTGKAANNPLRIRFKLKKDSEQCEEAAHDVICSEWSLGKGSDGDSEAEEAMKGSDGDSEAEEAMKGSPVQVQQDVLNDGIIGMIEDSGSSESKKIHIPTCSECSRTFPSYKSLYGHLRCHPRRRYRGVNPPPEEAKKLQPSVDSSSDGFLRASSWPVTAKRGRKLSINSDPETTAATILLFLSRGIRPDPGQAPIIKEEADQLVPDMKRKSMSNVEIEDEGNAKDRQLRDAKYLGHPNASGDWNWNTDGIEANDDEYIETSSCQSAIDQKIKKKKMKNIESVHASSVPTGGGKYRCKTCPKSFRTHQALGGHRASHNKNKNKNNPDEVVEETEDAGLNHAEELVDANSVVPKEAAAKHQCQICKRLFTTGQALGGHKRQHWTESQNQAASSSSVAPPLGILGKEKVDFDLNKLPRLEGEEF